nr:PREDICTED: receptor-type tyrosine-protein phosphatase V-like [Opisthocomus hoazin]
MDPEEVQMDPVIRQEPGLLGAVTAALCVSVLSACLFSVGTLLNLTVSDHGRSDSLLLSWDEPDGGAEGYSLTLSSLGSGTPLQNGSAGPNITNFWFHGLTPGMHYEIEVTATLACMETTSQTVTAQTSPSPVRNLSLSSSGSSAVLHASWVHAHGKRDGYHLALYHSDSQTLVRNVSILPNASTFLFDGLLAGSEYALKVSTLAGSSQASTSTHQWTAPSMPTQLRLSPGSSPSLVASWADAAGAAWLHLALHNLLTQTVTTTLSVALDFPHASDPLSPGNVTLSSAEEQGSLQARWSTPAGQRDFYLVTLQEGEDGAPTRNISVGGDNGHVTFHGLSPGKQYSVQVTAVAGPYRASARSTAAWTQPLAPSAVSLSSQGSPDSLVAIWEEAMGEGYTLALSPEEHPVRNSSLLRGVTNFTYEGLRPGTLYTFEVSTVAGPYTSSARRITNWTHPLPPEQLNLTNQGHSTSLQASWRAAPTGSTGYTGTLRETKSQERVRNMTVGNNWTNVTFEGLVPGRQYTLEMAAMAGPYRSPVRSATDWTYPLAPAGVTLTNTRRPLGLSAFWDKAAGDVDQFHLQLYSKSHAAQRNISVGPNTRNFTFLGLSPGIQYFLKVTVLAGPYRSSSHFATEWTYPLSLANVSVQPGRRPQELHVSWVESGGGREHLVQLSVAESLSVIRNVSVPRGVNQLDLEGLVPGSRYRVEIISQAGPHRISSQTAIGYTAPLSPLSLSASPVSTAWALAVHWETPPGQRDGYLLSVQEEGSSAPARSLEAGKDSTNVTLAQLEPGTCYLVGIWAVAGPYRSLPKNTTGCTVPAAPMNLSLTNPGSSSELYMCWNKSPGRRDHYRVILYSLSIQGRDQVQTLGPDAQNITWTHLEAGSKFAVQVVAVKGSFEAASTNVTQWTHPLAPANLTLRSPSASTLQASWAAAGRGAESYVVEVCDTASSSAGRTVLGGDARSHIFRNLSPGTRYSVSVRATAGPFHSSTPSLTHCTRPLPPATVRLLSTGHPDRLRAFWGPAARGRAGPTPQAAAPNISGWTHPLAPRNVHMTNQGYPNRLSASWRAEPQGQDSYRLLLYHSGAGTVAANVSVGKGTSKFTFSGLAPGHKYLLEVVSVAGPYAASAGNISDWTTPSVPTNLSAVAEGNSTMLISWGSVSGEQDDCQLWLRDPRNSTLPWRHALGRGQGQHLLQGLIPGRNYSVSLNCVAGPYWSSTKILAVPMEPNPVEDVQCLPDSRSLYLNWTSSPGDVEAYEVVTERLSDGPPTSKYVMSIPTNEASLEGLGPNSSYRIVVRTVGMNTMKSQAVTLLCNTTVEALPPPLRADIFQVEASSTVIISSDLFSEENGQIEYYGVVATTNDSLLRPTQEIMSSTWYDHYYGTEDSYLAVLIPNPFHPSPRSSPETWRVSVGTEECGQSRATCNGKLKANEQYRFSIAAFTRYDPVAPAVTFTMFSAAGSGADATPLSMPIIAGIVLGFLLTLAAIFALVYWRQLRAKRNKKSSLPQEMVTYSLRNVHRPIPIQNFKQYYEMKTASANHAFFQEFEELKEVGKDQLKVEAELPANVSKNRYAHVLPYDHSRVKLSQLGEDPHSDYINANFMPGYTSQQEFIATQGPLKKTIEDFWRLVWEQNVCNIIMLTVCMENGRVLCDHYWPSESAPVSYGQVRVHLLTQSSSNEWTMREFKLWHEGLQAERHVSHMHYTAWPDHGIPESTTSIMTFRELVREHIQSTKDAGPTLVHCRSCPIPLKTFAQHYAQKAAKSHVGFLREYETLLEVVKEEASSATPSSGNQQTRPSSSILPYDRSRVKFSLLEQGPFSDLLQVWRVPGCSSSREYLAVQGPDKLTMEDFWTLVWEQDVHTILTLLAWQEQGEVPSEACWPLEGDSLCTKMLTIQCGTEKLASGWRCIQLKMKHEKKAKERQVQRFLYKLWSSKKQPDVQDLVELLTAVRRCMPHRKRAGPLLLHCSGGMSQMGTLISLDCLLHQMKAERIVDIYGVTLQLTRSCCLMTPTLDQYMFLYTCIRDIIAQKQP